MNNNRTMFAMIAIVVAIGLVAAVAAVAVSSIVIQQQALADPPHGNGFGNCHSFGPGHSNDACR